MLVGELAAWVVMEMLMQQAFLHFNYFSVFY